MHSKLLSTLVLLACSACADFTRGPFQDAGPVLLDDGGVAADAGPSLRFESNVHDLLLADCRFCHQAGGLAADSAWLLTGSLDDDYAVTTLFVDEATPAASRLLTKAEGRAHGGGAVFPVGSSSHALILLWITQGALP